MNAGTGWAGKDPPVGSFVSQGWKDGFVFSPWIETQLKEQEVKWPETRWDKSIKIKQKTNMRENKKSNLTETGIDKMTQCLIDFEAQYKSVRAEASIHRPGHIKNYKICLY